MDIVFNMIRFEWDEEKEKLNREKHGIGFGTAARVFFDDSRIELWDERHSGEEDRYITIGMVHDVLFVVYTERSDSLRLISARLANEKERRIYFGDSI